MKKEIFQEIEIPEGVEMNIEGSILKVKGEQGENQREFKTPNFEINKTDNKIIIGTKKATKREKKMINTITAHIKNMIKGVQEKFVYQLKSVFNHFPMTVEVQNDKAIVSNFLGEKVPREVKIPKNAEVTMDKEFITVSSFDKEIAGQTAANFEKATRIPKKDRRVFQDGIFIINKAGREM